ncbi:unnamed protein product, partial [Soboliphyme baturini]|uniref:G_PROTEIN_RECEP_F1_2 domain-containing protein n=1 Tax=Soboliphyme baturini TaxID=241478 RepID=A0A183IL03_9BILA
YTILAQASLAIDRYLQIVWQRSPKIWHRWIIVCLNLVITIVTTIPQGLQDAFGGKPGVTCVVDMRKYDFAINSGSLFIMAMSYVVTLACGMRLLLFLKSYRKQNLSIRQRMNLRDNSDISNLILIQTVLAVSLQPMTIIMYVIDGIILGVPQWLRFTLIMCYYITPMLNSVILFYIIKPYRRALMKMIGRRVQPVESIAAIQNNSTLLELGGFSSVHNRLKMAN